VPEFLIAHVLINAPPGAMIVPSGMVTSAMKVEERVQVVGPEDVGGGAPVAAGVAVVGSDVAVEIGAVGLMTRVAVGVISAIF
jgi:hypothetical protein